MAKPSPWGGEPERLEPCPFCDHTALHWFRAEGYHAIRCAKCCGEGPPTDTKAEAIAAWNRRTPSQSPDGYEVQWRPRGSDTWDGGSAGVYRTAAIAAEVAKEFAENGHETRVRAIAYVEGSDGQGPYPPDTGRTHWEGCWRERGHHGCAVAMVDDLRAQLAEFDAAPVTDARIWDGVRDAIEKELARWLRADGRQGEVAVLAAALARIALGERVEADHG